MALRHPVPDGCEMPVITWRKEPEMLKLLREPKEVVFRHDAVETFLDQVQGLARFKVRAGVGARKSVDFPLAFRERTGRPVVHCVPSRLLAVSLYDHLNHHRPGKYDLMVSSAHVVRPDRVTITYGAALVLKVLADYSLAADVARYSPLGNNVHVVLDECHESDAYSYFLWNAVHTVQGVASVALMSATFTAEPVGSVKVDVERISYEPQLAAEWDVTDASKPWGIRNLVAPTLVFVDNTVAADKLASSYIAVGVTAHRLTAGMAVDKFRSVVQDLETTSAMVVAIADYSFRSGFTFPAVTRVIDDGKVRVAVENNGKTMYRMRDAYKYERLQASGRVGRIAGKPGKYYEPAGQADAAICSLEGPERHAACILFNAFGCVPPAELSDVPEVQNYYSGVRFPKALQDVLGASQHLDTVPDSFFVGLQVKAENVSSELDDVLNQYIVPDKVSDTTELFESIDVEHINTNMHQEMDFLNTLAGVGEQGVALHLGACYSMRGVPPNTGQGIEVDWREVCSNLKRDVGYADGLENTYRVQVAQSLLTEYNAAVILDQALGVVLSRKDEIGAYALAFPEQVGMWSKSMKVKNDENAGKARRIAEAMRYLVVKRHPLIPLKDMYAGVPDVAASLVNSLKRAIDAVTGEVDEAQHMRAAMARIAIDSPDVGGQTVAFSPGDESCAIGVRKFPVRGLKGSVRLEITLRDPQLWDFRSVLSAMSKFVADQQMSSDSIYRIVVVDDAAFDSNALLSELKKTDKHRRRKRMYTITAGSKGGGVDTSRRSLRVKDVSDESSD